MSSYPTSSTSSRRPLVAFALLALILLAGFGISRLLSSGDSQQNAPANGEPPKVDVVTLKPESTRLWNDFSGRLSAVDYVEVRPKVSGTITEVLFEEGSIVEAGDPLFTIDPRPFEAAVKQAEAALAAARSQAQLAGIELRRAQKLVKDSVISQSVYDNRRSAYQVAQAAIRTAEAQLATAKLDLEYAHITAPVAGRISRAEITVGNVVEAGSSAPLLTTIVANQLIYAEFDVDEQTYLQSVRQSETADMPVQLTLPGDSSRIYQGAIRSFDNRLDSTSGTIRARAIFHNQDGLLLPGMYVNVRLGSANQKEILAVSEHAIGTDQNRKFVYVISPEHDVTYRPVELGRNLGGKRLVLAGLQAGEQVMVNSLQRVRPGMKVTPVELETDTPPPLTGKE